MKTFGLIGFPLSHSFSRGYFTRKFANEKIDARYLNFPIPTIDGIIELVDLYPQLAGLNVTIPYKEQVIPFLDDIDPEAAKIGAVNVIKISRKDNKPVLKGFNSDSTGFSNSLVPLLMPHHSKALILGTGGAAKAVAHALIKLGIAFFNVSRVAKNPHHLAYSSLTPAIISEHKLIINTSPLGMYPDTGTFPPLPYEGITSQHLVYDLIYNPAETTFMKKSAENGAVTKNGLEMLELQADEAWRIWNVD